ncbi:glycosyltransferase family 4 protein [Patescibacteria group bacterium]|nr:glycosyltransferase family 4 protein [Patescibacteria group bacterium]
MKLLITTQKVDMNDDVLGFFHGWISEFAKNYEKVTVICLERGQYDLPKNVKVLSLGKEGHKTGKAPSIFTRLNYIKNFLNYIIDEEPNYDKVFVHMNPEYMALGGLFWRFWGKKTALWYTHRNVDLKLKIAEKFTNVIFTASKESFLLKSKKVQILGHGVNIEKFKCNSTLAEKKSDILYVGRISKIKNQKLLIEAVDILVKKFKLNKLKAVFVGGAVTEEDKKYFEKLKNLVKKNKLEKNVIFEGSIPNKDIVNYYCGSRVSVNLCPTGGMDKVVLESMSCGIPIVVFNKTFSKILDNSRLVLEKKDKNELAEKINFLFDFDINRSNKLRKLVVDDFSLDKLINKIVTEI